MANLQPKCPNSYPSDAAPCDPQLPIRALQHRIEHQLMSERDFSGYNVSVWLLKNRDRVEYVVEHNKSLWPARFLSVFSARNCGTRESATERP